MVLITVTEKQTKTLFFYILLKYFQEYSHLSDFCYSQLLLIITCNSERIILMDVFCCGLMVDFTVHIHESEACRCSMKSVSQLPLPSFPKIQYNWRGAVFGRDWWRIRYKLFLSLNNFLLIKYQICSGLGTVWVWTPKIHALEAWVLFSWCERWGL